MKKKHFLVLAILAGALFKNQDVYAYDVNNYRYRNLCGNFEVASFKSDGSINQVSCHSNYESARSSMRNNGNEELAIMAKVNGETKIIDANLALLDLSVNPTAITYFYPSVDSKTSYTYMDTGSLYGGVDGVHMDTAYSNVKNKWTVKVRTGNFTGWIEQQSYEIVPMSWVKSHSSYTVTNSDIRHNYVAKIQNDYYGSSGRTIGPKPEMLKTGTYYSYDGHYFYNDMRTLIRDAKNNNYNNSVNKDSPYYNYYMYLSNHTRTTYSSINIDDYIRNNMGIKEQAYGNASKNGSSRLYGSGNFFYYAQEKYGVNAILSLSLSRNETGNGTSNLAINKNNGFGLNAVDSNPTEAANWYATFPSSILGYASKWITYGYAHPRDWRYFGPQFGDKWIGMNVKYASDTFWSEKMASNYYNLDKAYGLQDYNYYQLGVVKSQTNAYSEPATSSKFIYSYPEAEDAVVIIDEVERNGELWYKVVSDLNIDSNYNEITSGDYNWNGYVYVKASNVKKINKGKNGYINPNEVTEYINKDYEYNLYDQNQVFQPRVAITTKNTDYYYDSSLQSRTGKTLLKDKYVMVYAQASLNNKPVAYLVTSDYWKDQREWVNADSLKFTNSKYGKVSVTVSGNQYTWVNYNTVDAQWSLISGLYTNSYVPVLDETVVDGHKWYKVPVALTDNNNSYGYTLAQAPGVNITLSTAIVDNNPPTINAVDKTIIENDSFEAKEGVTATDPEDGDITKKIKIIKNTVKTDIPGEYEVTYEVTDNHNTTTTKTIKVTVKENKAPVINAEDKTIKEQTEFKELEGVTATDTEDGDLTKKIKVIENTVKTDTPGVYKVVYEVEDNNKKKTTKEIKVEVLENKKPIIKAENKVITAGTKFEPLEGVTATDEEDGDLTKEIEVVKDEVNEKEIGTYEVTYKVVDSFKNETTKTIKVEVVENQKPIINAKDKTIYLNEKFDPLEGITAKDPEDGDITKDIQVKEDTVNEKELGEYKVIYEVEDSYGHKVELEIKVLVIEKKLEEKDGIFYFNYLKEDNGILKLQGYQTIIGIDNNLETDIAYKIILENIDTKETKEVKAKRITQNIPKPVYSPDGKDYNYSWFDADIDINKLDLGNYRIYIEASTEQYYSKSLVNNKSYQPQVTSTKGEKNSATINNNYDSQISYVEVKVREKLLANKNSSHIYNQYDKYTVFEFTDGKKLHLRGNSYSYGMDLGKDKKVTRKIIFENKETYETYTKDLDSITNGNYNVVLPVADNLDKTKAWYDKELDISDIKEGEYIIYLTTSSNITDISELTEKLGRSLEDVKKTINNKEYTFQINKSRGSRIEMQIRKK